VQRAQPGAASAAVWDLLKEVERPAQGGRPKNGGGIPTVSDLEEGKPATVMSLVYRLKPTCKNDGYHIRRVTLPGERNVE
jgi:hypothetical protein